MAIIASFSTIGVSIEYAVEEQPLGTAGSVRNALHLLDETFVVISGDALCDFDLREIARSGVRPLVVAALGLVVVAACSLGLVLLTSGWLRLS